MQHNDAKKSCQWMQEGLKQLIEIKKGKVSKMVFSLYSVMRREMPVFSLQTWFPKAFQVFLGDFQGQGLTILVPTWIEKGFIEVLCLVAQFNHLIPCSNWKHNPAPFRWWSTYTCSVYGLYTPYFREKSCDCQNGN